jgi:broad specificity phosphatase PhoE
MSTHVVTQYFVIIPFMNSKNFTTIYIVRHGETEWNVQGLLQGQMDSPLTIAGKDQARLLGQELAHVQFDAVFSSDLERTKKTAEIIGLEKKLAVKTTEALRERAFGTFEGKKYAVLEEELKDLIAEYETLQDKEKLTFRFRDDMETEEEVLIRFLRFLREIGVAYSGKTVLLVTHGGTMRTLLVHLGFGTYKQLHHSAVKNGGYLVLESDGVEFFIKETKGITLLGELQK